MTRANDIASLVDSNGDIVAGALDNVPPSNDASALTTGTLDAARLPSSSVDASSLTTGTLDNARLPSSRQADNYHDGQGVNSGSNVNLGSGGTEGRGVVAGFSGSSYPSLGYNLRHTTSGDQYVAPGTDTTSFVEFPAGGISAYGAAGGTAGRTLNKSGMTKLFEINSSGNWADAPSGTVINKTEYRNGTYLITSNTVAWINLWTVTYTPKMANSKIYVDWSISSLPEGNNTHDYWMGIYNNSALTGSPQSQQYFYEGTRASGISGWQMAQINLKGYFTNFASVGSNVYILLQMRNASGTGSSYFNYSNADSAVHITEAAP